jgi:hypothetical protein
VVADFGPRQGSGKSDIINARELAGLVLFGEQLIIHTAHEFPTANESFLRLVAVLEAWDDLRKMVAHIRYANGAQAIELLSGQRLLYKARTGGGVRGFAKADLTVYDEAQHIKAEHVAASGPAKLANPNAQSWYAGSGGLETSKMAWALRKMALRGAGPRFAYTEHTAEQVSLTESGRVQSVRPDDVMDRKVWSDAMPGYGYWVSDESIEALHLELGGDDDLFAREALCVWDPEIGADEARQIDVDQWDRLVDAKSKPVGAVHLAVDVSPDRKWTSFGLAGRRADGLGHVETRDRRAGTGWLVARAKELCDGHSCPLLVDPRSPAGAFIGELAEAGVTVDEVSGTRYAQACSALATAVGDGVLRHRGSAELRAAVSGARERAMTDAWAWSRANSETDISPLVAVTLAWGMVPTSTVDAAENVW